MSGDNKTGPTRSSCGAWALGWAMGWLMVFGLVTSTARAAEPQLEIGVLPNVSARVLAQQYEPMQNYLAQRLGRPVAVSTAPDWREFYQRVKRGDYQVVIAAANVARLMEADLGYKPVLAYEPKIPALLIASRSTTNTTPSALLRNKLVAMANPSSLVVFEGLTWLERQGLEAGRDFQIMTVRRDDSVGNVVLRGEAAAGILSMGEFQAHPESQRDLLAVVSVMAEVPSFVISVSKEMPSDKLAQLRNALTSFSQGSDEGKQFFMRSGFRAIAPVSTRDMAAMDAYVDKTRKALD